MNLPLVCHSAVLSRKCLFSFQEPCRSEWLCKLRTYSEHGRDRQPRIPAVRCLDGRSFIDAGDQACSGGSRSSSIIAIAFSSKAGTHVAVFSPAVDWTCMGFVQFHRTSAAFHVGSFLRTQDHLHHISFILGKYRAMTR